jgi:hypothetical protein
MKRDEAMHPMLPSVIRSAARAVLALAMGGVGLLGLGCGEEPGPEDLLTLVEIETADRSAFGPGDSAIAAQVAITFRDWFNGGIVVETRVSSTLTAEEISPLLAGDAEAHALAWERVMAASIGAGMAERLEVGYQGLIREHEFQVPVTIPAGVDSSGNPYANAFLVAYLADIEEIEIDDQPDSLVITPYGQQSGILNDVVPIAIEGNP